MNMEAGLACKEFIPPFRRLWKLVNVEPKTRGRRFYLSFLGVFYLALEPITGLLDDVALFSGIVSAEDIAAIAAGTLSPGSFLSRVDLADFAIFASNWLRSDCSEANLWCDGYDFNGDNSVDASDLAEFAAGWLR